MGIFQSGTVEYIYLAVLCSADHGLTLVTSRENTETKLPNSQYSEIHLERGREQSLRLPLR